MNKTGDIPTVLILPVAFALMALAIFSFLTTDKDVKNPSMDIARVVNSAGFYEGYVIKEAEIIARESILGGDKNLKERYQKIADERDMQVEGAGNFFGKIRNGEFVFIKSGDFYNLEIRGLFVQSEKGVNKMKRDFDIIKSIKMEQT